MHRVLHALFAFFEDRHFARVDRSGSTELFVIPRVGG
jgi:hypothetical protein